MDPQDQQQLNRLYERYIELLQQADGITRQQAQAQADQAKAAGNLTTSVSRLNKELNDTVFKSDYLYQSFRDTTTELKKQNALLQAGKSVFKGLTTLSSDLNYFQQGITDLTEKQLKKKGEILAKNKLELTNIQDRLGEEKQINGVKQLVFRQEKELNDLSAANIDDLTAAQKKLLNQLKEEKDLFEATNNALSEGLPLLQKELDISKQIYDVREDLGGMATAAAGVISKYGGSLAQFLNVDDAIDSVKKYNQELISDALKSKEVIEKIKNIEDQRIALLRNSLRIQGEIQDKEREIAAASVQTNQEIALRNELLDIQNQLQTATGQDAIDLATRLSQINSDISIIETDRSTRIADLQNEKQQKKNDLLDDERNTKRQLAALDEKEDKVKQDAIASVNNLGNKFKSLGVLIKGVGVGLKKALTDPLTIITFFIDKALDANKQAVELGKSLGYGNDRADAFRENMVGIVNNSNNLNVTTTNLVEAFGQLSEATGLAYEFTADQLETQIKLTKQVGLQADEAAQIQRFAVLNGKTSEETYKLFVKGLAATRNQLKVGINFKAALSEAAKVSGQLAANLGNNPETIAKAVVTAKAFGMTLDQVAKSGEALLNFESSIENELKAELLTGKQLNLERARAAALAGDQITLAEELAKNVGTAAEFTKMNVLQQKALAESVGMTADELANTLRKREEAIASGKSLAQITAEEAAEALERQTIQDKFNAAILKLQDLFGNLMAGPLGSFLDMLSGALNIINSIMTPLKIIGGLWLGIVATKKIALGYDIAMKAANQISANLGLAQIGTNRVKLMLEKESLLTRIAGNIQLFRQLAAEQGVMAALRIQFGLQQATNVVRQQSLLLTIREFITTKATAAWDAIRKTGLVAINALKSAGAIISKKDALFSIAGAAMGALKAAVSGVGALLGPLAIPLGIAAAAGVAALGYNLLKGDDVMSEGGYGKRTLLSPEGAIKLNDKDTVIAGTNLGGGDDKAKTVTAPQSIDGDGEAKTATALQSVASTLIEMSATSSDDKAKTGEAKTATALQSVASTLIGMSATSSDDKTKIVTAPQSIDDNDKVKTATTFINLDGGNDKAKTVTAPQSISSDDKAKTVTASQSIDDNDKAKTATALQSIASTLIGMSATFAAIDISKLGTSDEFLNNQSSNSITSGTTDTITTPVKAIDESIGGKEEINTGIDLTPMIAAINEVTAAVNKLYNKDTAINMDGKKVGTTLVQNSYKAA